MAGTFGMAGARHRPRPRSSLLPVLVASLAAAAGCEPGEEDCSPDVTSIAVTEAELRVVGLAPADAVPCVDGVCEGACCFADGGCGPGLLECSLTRGGSPLAPGTFEVELEPGDGDELRVDLKSSEPGLELGFVVPVAFGREGETAWTADAADPSFRFRAMDSCSLPVPSAAIAGSTTIEVASPGGDAEDRVEVIRIAGRIEPLESVDRCSSLPEVDFTLQVTRSAREGSCPR